ncbi:ABC transporter permease [Anaerotalea alkaliphila]|nr:FtsX-like permease family protein [Anaerotalea alkaliphila]
MFKENPARHIGILVLVLIGSFTFVLASGISRNLGDLMTDFMEENRQEDISFRTDRPIPDRESLEEQAGALIEESLSLDAPLSDTATLRLLGATRRVNVPAVLEGRMPEGPEELLLEPTWAGANGYTVGSTLQAGGKSFTVVGYVALPNYIYPLQNPYDILPSPERFGVGVVDPAALEGMEGVVKIQGARFLDRDGSINQQTVRLRELLLEQGVAASDWIPIGLNRRASTPWASVTGMRTMSVPLPVGMFLLSCLVMGILVWRMVRQDAVVVGTLYAQGYRRRELMRHYMALPLLVALAGGTAGSLLALSAIRPSVLAMLDYYVLPVTAIRWSAPELLAGLLAPVLFLGLGGWLAVRSELKRPPAELMKGGSRKTKVSALERKLRLEGLRFGTRFKLREQLRSIPRLLFLLLGVVGASLIMLLAFTILSSFTHLLTSDIRETYRFDYEYAFRELQTGEVPEGAEAFSGAVFHLEGDEGAEFWASGVQPDSRLLTLRDKDGNLLPNDRTNITRPLAERLGVEAGDTIRVVGKLTGKVHEFRIDAVAQSYTEHFLFLPIDRFNEELGYPPDSHMGLFSTRELEIPPEALAGVKDMGEIPAAMEAFFGATVAMVGAMVLLSGVMGLIIIQLVTSLIIEENRNTISLFKVFGYRRREVRSLILDSTDLVVLAGFLAAIPLAAASFGSVYSNLGDTMDFTIPTVVDPLYVLLSFLLVLATYLLAKKLGGRKVDRVSMAETLKAVGE